MPLLKFVRENAAFLLAGVLIAFTSSYGQTYFISIFAGQIREEFSLSHGNWGLIYTVGTTISAMTMVWAGALTDRFRTRQLGLIVMVGLAIASLAMAAVPSAMMLIAVIFLLRLTGQGMMSHLAMVSMARWFVARRGTAMSIASMGFALGQAVLPIAFVALLGIFDWRLLWVGAALLVMLTLPVIISLLRLERTPQSVAESTQSTGMGNRHWTRNEVIRHPLFWMMIPALLGPPAWGTALFFQQVHLVEVKGWELAQWVALMPIFTVMMIGSNFSCGLAIDKLGSPAAISVYMIPFALGSLIIGASGSLTMAGLGLAVFAIGNGMQTTTPGAFWAEFFGTRHLGSIKAVASAIMVFGSAIGPGLTGVLIDYGIDFPQQLFGIAVYFACAGALAVFGVLRARSALPAPA
ncbi:MFS transporter [Pelagovum pacificum]|uniref:MFS transporter n=1 Tax=Pelagovum pacificum TaxID=2588711 RepID=A0A5C5GH50_9RHOB|nr:MFS transporter [Pelagovum pacificum]QQA42767.1 MFS transporter [Pelagovum pacificum]TNY34085.1 MFS transporter [Pelagovum pacificum]